MARVSLILPVAPGDPRPEAAIPAYRQALEQSGHQVDVVIAVGPGASSIPSEPGQWRTLVITDSGLAAAAVAGLNSADGDILLVVDPCMGYTAESLPRVVEAIQGDGADLVISSRFMAGGGGSRIGKWAGKLLKWMGTTTDPLSGLIGLSKTLRDDTKHNFTAAGTKFSLELLNKLEGRRVDVPVSTRGPSRKFRPDLDEIRHLKRMADHRFGSASHLIQFCLVGASGMVVDLSCYLVFQFLCNLTPLAGHFVPKTEITFSLATARVMAIAVALVWNFSLNRRLTFSYARAGAILPQFATYVASNLLGILVSLTVSLGLPARVPFFAAHKLAAAVVGIVLATGISFSMSRWVVFRRKKVATPAEETTADATSRDEDGITPRVLNSLSIEQPAS